METDGLEARQNVLEQGAECHSRMQLLHLTFDPLQWNGHTSKSLISVISSVTPFNVRLNLCVATFKVPWELRLCDIPGGDFWQACNIQKCSPQSANELQFLQVSRADKLSRGWGSLQQACLVRP